MTKQANTLNQFIADQVAADKSRDDIIVALVTEHDMSLNKATKVYGDYAKEHGLTTAIVSHKAEALEWLAQQAPSTDDWTAQAVRDAVLELAEEFDVAESTARDYCKAYSKQLGVELPVTDPREAMFNWFVQADASGNPVTKEDFIEFACGELGRSKSNANEYWKGYELHLALLAAAK